MRGSIKFLIACVIAGLLFHIHATVEAWGTLSQDQKADVRFLYTIIGMFYTGITFAFMVGHYDDKGKRTYEVIKWYCPVYWVTVVVRYVAKFLDKIFD